MLEPELSIVTFSWSNCIQVHGKEIQIMIFFFNYLKKDNELGCILKQLNN